MPAPENPPRRIVSRTQTARTRAIHARASLQDCHLCAHHCGINRLAGQEGPCHAGPHARVFSAQTEVSDELQLIPTFAIALSGCDLRCDFCITGRDSWNTRAGEPFSPRDTALRAKAALRDGAKTIMILGGEPTIHLPDVLDFIALLPDDARLIWKTNAHGSAQARDLIAGLFDVHVPDFKFGNDTCAQRLAKVPDYGQTVRENIRWMARDADLIVRHLLMPNHLDCCWRPIAEWLAAELPGVKVNLRSGFWPAWQTARHLDLRTPTPAHEIRRAFDLARDLHLNLVP